MAGKRVKFCYISNDKKIQNVYLAGDFTDWDRNAILMKKNKLGDWTVIKSLTPGEHEYKYIVDGRWSLDPKAQTRVNNFGAENSVIKIE